MPRYAALLRAINVGGHTVKMDELRALFESLRLSSVESVIASGNVLFDTRAADPASLESRIEARLKRALGYEVDTFVRTADDLDAVVAHQPPFAADDPILPGHILQVIFTRSAIAADAHEKLAALCSSYDDLHAHGREIYWRTRGRSSDSKITPAMFARTKIGVGTARNITTVRKLALRLRD
jgi:uncharacterized protein (DUF1697 family)